MPTATLGPPRPSTVHRWSARGTTPCGLRIAKGAGVATNIGRTHNHGVTCPACLQRTTQTR